MQRELPDRTVGLVHGIRITRIVNDEARRTKTDIAVHSHERCVRAIHKNWRLRIAHEGLDLPRVAALRREFFRVASRPGPRAA
jgi:hypothetical protein